MKVLSRPRLYNQSGRPRSAAALGVAALLSASLTLSGCSLDALANPPMTAAPAPGSSGSPAAPLAVVPAASSSAAIVAPPSLVDREFSLENFVAVLAPSLGGDAESLSTGQTVLVESGAYLEVQPSTDARRHTVRWACKATGSVTSVGLYVAEPEGRERLVDWTPQTCDKTIHTFTLTLPAGKTEPVQVALHALGAKAEFLAAVYLPASVPAAANPATPDVGSTALVDAQRARAAFNRGPQGQAYENARQAFTPEALTDWVVGSLGIPQQLIVKAGTATQGQPIDLALPPSEAFDYTVYAFCRSAAAPSDSLVTAISWGPDASGGSSFGNCAGDAFDAQGFSIESRTLAGHPMNFSTQENVDAEFVYVIAQKPMVELRGQ